MPKSYASIAARLTAGVAPAGESQATLTDEILDDAATKEEFDRHAHKFPFDDPESFDAGRIWKERGEEFFAAVLELALSAKIPRSDLEAWVTQSVESLRGIEDERPHRAIITEASKAGMPYHQLYFEWAARAAARTGQINPLTLYLTSATRAAPAEVFRDNILIPSARLAYENGHTSIGDALLPQIPIDDTQIEVAVPARAGSLAFFEQRFFGVRRQKNNARRATDLERAFVAAAGMGQLSLLDHLAQKLKLTPERLSWAWRQASVNLASASPSVTWLVNHGHQPDTADDPVVRGAWLVGRHKIAELVWAKGGRVTLAPDDEFHQALWRTSVANIRAASTRLKLNDGVLAALETLLDDESEDHVEKVGLLKEIAGKDCPLVDAAATHHFATAVHRGRFEIAAWLRSRGAEIGTSAIESAIGAASAERLDFLIQQGLELSDLYLGLAEDRLGPAGQIASRSTHITAFNAPVLDRLAGFGAELTDRDILILSRGVPFTDFHLEGYLAALRLKGGEKVIPRNQEFAAVLAARQQNAREWQRRVHIVPPPGLAAVGPAGFRPTTFDEVRSWLEMEMAPGTTGRRRPSYETAATINQYARNLTVLFSNADRVLQYLDRHGRPGKTPLHDLAQFKLPQDPGWDVKAWSDACLKFGPAMAKYVSYAPKLGAPETLAKTRERVAQFVYERGAENPSIAAMCYELGVQEEDFDAVLDAHQLVVVDRASEEVPAITLDGKEFGMPGARWFRAEPGDARILVAGEFTNCCQHIGEAGEACAIHSATSPYGACYFLTKPGKRGEEIIGVSWAWRGTNGEFCLDSFEPLDPIYSEAFPAIVEAMKGRLIAEYPEVTKFTVGVAGRTPSLRLPILAETESPKPRDFSGYRDSDVQYLVFDSAGENELQNQVARALVNELDVAANLTAPER